MLFRSHHLNAKRKIKELMIVLGFVCVCVCVCVHVFKNPENLTQVLNVGEAYKHMGRRLVAGKVIVYQLR